jgi:hypothetical protein
MSKWATIDREKLEREIQQLSIQLTIYGDRKLSVDRAFEAYRILAEHNALMTVLNCISRPTAPVEAEDSPND